MKKKHAGWTQRTLTYGRTQLAGLLREGILPNMVDFEKSKRARKRITNYCW